MPGGRYNLPFDDHERLQKYSIERQVHTNEVIRRSMVLLIAIEEAIQRGDKVILMNKDGKNREIILGWLDNGDDGQNV